MEFEADRGELLRVAHLLAELGEVVASPGRHAITAYDVMHTRRVSYAPQGVQDGDGSDIGLDAAALLKVARRVRDMARIEVTPERLVIRSGDTVYKLRTLEPAPYMNEPHADCPGRVAMPAADLRAALQDVGAAGSVSVIIAIRDGKAVFRGDDDTSCWIEAPAATTDGIGYSRLDLGLLLPCVSSMSGLAAEISLSPKGATAIRFGDFLTYHQAARL